VARGEEDRNWGELGMLATGQDTLRARTAKRKLFLPEIAAHVKGAVS